MTDRGVRLPAHSYVHRCPYVEVFLVHFFSGVRRDGDIQSWVEKLLPATTYIVTVLSVDILYNEEHGDLTNDVLQRKWLDFAMTGAIAACWLGPPCSTWSIAREHGLLLDDDGPRPVRSIECPFGLSALSLKELAEVSMGNTLLFFTGALFAISCFLGCICMIEHPAVPEWYQRRQTACIWRTGLLRTLLQLPGAASVQIYQGYYGAASPKPTMFAISNCKESVNILGLHRTHPLPPPIQMGKKSDAGYSTAALKEYPAQLAKCMALIGLEWVRRNDPAERPVEIPSLYREMVKPFCIDFTGLHCIGRDTRGAGAGSHL